MKPIGLLLGVVLCIGGVVASTAGAQSPPSLDDELMRDLGGDPTAELKRELFGEKPADAPLGDELKQQLERELGAAAEREDDDPLLRIARQMQRAGQLLEGEAGKGAASVQKDIVDELDRLIAQAKKQCKSGACQNSSNQSTRTASGSPKPSGNSQKPGRSPGERQADRTTSTPAKRVDPAEMQQLLKRVWGDLPERIREQVLQLPSEEFLPKYETLIEEYYRRLAEGRE
jgi:hypothetical protein